MNESDTRSELTRRTFEDLRAGRHEMVRANLTTARTRFPRHAAMVEQWIAEMCVHLKDPESAVRGLEIAVDKGMWWSPELLATRPLVVLREHPRFAAVLQECVRRQRAATRPDGDPVIVEHWPERAVGVLLGLHGGASPEAGPHALARRWAPAALAEGLGVVFPRSSQPSSSDGTVGWSDPAAARREVIAALTGTLEANDARGLPVVISGFSRGAALAVEWALDTSWPATPTFGFVAVAPRNWHDAAIARVVPGGATAHRRGAILHGEYDDDRDAGARLGAELVTAGVSCAIELMPGVGHELPGDLTDRLALALRFVLARPGLSP